MPISPDRREELSQRAGILKLKTLQVPEQNFAGHLDAAAAATNALKEDACDRFVTGLDSWATSQPGFDPQARFPNLARGKASLKVTKKPLGAVKFKDRKGVLRTTDAAKWGQRTLSLVGILPHFKWVAPQTLNLLTAYVASDSQGIANAFCSAPTVVHGDLLRFSEGPIFDPASTFRIMKNLQVQIKGNVPANRLVFNAGVFVITNHLMGPAYRKRTLSRGYKVKPTKTKKLLAAEYVPQSLATLHLALTPSRTTTNVDIEKAVSRHSVMFAMFSEAVFAAVGKLDNANERHVRHVGYGVAFAFAGLNAALSVAPFNGGEAINTMIDPFKDIILKKQAGKYTAGALAANYKEVMRGFLDDVALGVLVPGLDNSQETRDRASATRGRTTLDDVEREERRAWGKEFRANVYSATTAVHDIIELNSILP